MFSLKKHGKKPEWTEEKLQNSRKLGLMECKAEIKIHHIFFVVFCCSTCCADTSHQSPSSCIVALSVSISRNFVHFHISTHDEQRMKILYVEFIYEVRNEKLLQFAVVRGTRRKSSVFKLESTFLRKCFKEKVNKTSGISKP